MLKHCNYDLKFWKRVWKRKKMNVSEMTLEVMGRGGSVKTHNWLSVNLSDINPKYVAFCAISGAKSIVTASFTYHILQYKPSTLEKKKF